QRPAPGADSALPQPVERARRVARRPRRRAVSGPLLKMFLRSRKILAAVALAATLWPSLVQSEPHAVFSPTQHDFGDVRRGEKVTRSFGLHNGGGAPLWLVGVRLSIAAINSPP